LLHPDAAKVAAAPVTTDNMNDFLSIACSLCQACFQRNCTQDNRLEFHDFKVDTRPSSTESSSDLAALRLLAHEQLESKQRSVIPQPISSRVQNI
jgi:hypothetical protein